MHTVAAGEERRPTEHFGEYASDRPHVNCASVLFESKHDFRRAVPSATDHYSTGFTWKRWNGTHRVATYSVKKLLLSFAIFGGGRADLARPKSHS